MSDDQLKSGLEDEKKRIAAVSIYSRQPEHENRWGVMATFEAGTVLLLNAKAESLLKTTLGPPDERTASEFVGLVHCSPKELNEWASSETYTPPVPYNDQWAVECAKRVINRFHTPKDEETIDLLRLREPLLFSNFTGRSKDLIAMSSRDTWQRPAKVYIHSRLLRGSNDSGGTSDLLGRFTDAGGIFRHWGVIVDFGNGKAFTFDGTTRNSANVASGEFVVWVTPGWPDLNPASQQAMELTSEVTCSPKEIFELARKVLKIVPKYNMVLSNCQTWAVHFDDFLVERFGDRQKEETRSLPHEAGNPEERITLTGHIIKLLVITTLIHSILAIGLIQLRLPLILYLIIFQLSFIVFMIIINLAENAPQWFVSLLMTAAALLIEYFVNTHIPNLLEAYSTTAILISIAFAADVLPNWFVNLCSTTALLLLAYYRVSVVPSPSTILRTVTAIIIGAANATDVSSN